MKVELMRGWGKVEKEKVSETREQENKRNFLTAPFL
jgi:hypothetical protein